MKDSEPLPRSAGYSARDESHGERSANRGRHARSVRALRRYANLLDSSIPLPGGATIGIGSVIGLLPGIGDMLGALLATPILVRAWQLGVPVSVMVRMLANVGIDAVVGVVPLAGDLFDFAFKANEKNVALLEAYFTRSRRTQVRSRLWVALAGGVLLTVLVTLFYLLFLLSSAVLSRLLG